VAALVWALTASRVGFHIDFGQNSFENELFRKSIYQKFETCRFSKNRQDFIFGKVAH